MNLKINIKDLKNKQIGIISFKFLNYLLCIQLIGKPLFKASAAKEGELDLDTIQK